MIIIIYMYAGSGQRGVELNFAAWGTMAEATD